MSEARPHNCSECAYWRSVRKDEGLCRRYAPDGSKHAEKVAHWPQTHASQWCGEGRVGAATGVCSQCVYWRRPAGGLQPVDRADMPRPWWDGAGHCARRAPHPASEPGPRAFWRATRESDGCGDGDAGADR